MRAEDGPEVFRDDKEIVSAVRTALGRRLGPERFELWFGSSTQLAFDGRTLSVEDDWHAEIGDPVCGPDAVMTEPTEKSIALRNVACAIGRAGLFHHMLTPSANASHRNHFHFDIKRDADYRSLR